MKTRRELNPEGARRRLILIDSAALVAVTGSHGALFGSDSMNALKVDAALALFNDAGGGAGTSRHATVAASSARIGDAHSAWADGMISACNERASALGAGPGDRARDLVARALEALPPPSA